MLLKFAVAAVATAIAVAIALVAWGLRPAERAALLSTVDVELPQRDSGSVALGSRSLELGAHLLERARHGKLRTLRMGPAGGELREIRCQHDLLGFCRVTALPQVLSGPRIGVIGDSHVHGIVATEHHVGPLLESLLRDQLHPSTFVLATGKGGASLPWYAARLERMSREFDLDALVVVIFTGNDLLDLEDPREQHVDDDLSVREATNEPHEHPPEFYERFVALGFDLDEADNGMFWQGLSQAAWLHDLGERGQLLERKIRLCLDRIESAASAVRGPLVYVLLPSFDAVQPELARAKSERAAQHVGTNRRWHAWLRAELESRDQRVIDLLPVFEANAATDLYAADFHIWNDGHRLLAEALAAKLAHLVRQR